jgi:hypothetical protein
VKSSLNNLKILVRKADKNQLRRVAASKLVTPLVLLYGQAAPLAN